MRQVPVKHVHDVIQSSKRQCHGIAVGQKNPVNRHASGQDGLQLLFQFCQRAGSKALLLGGVHVTEGAFVPRATIGDLQYERFPLTGWTKDRFDVVHGVHGLIIAACWNAA